MYIHIHTQVFIMILYHIVTHYNILYYITLFDILLYYIIGVPPPRRGGAPGADPAARPGRPVQDLAN